ncbi:mitochondrial import inner membrane translocase [Striga asiatica]|uniref:Mitochondrial import inner membrane translocase n=1 Tax=Striga asiatica TaxID=4170 RepID=A0A5A7QZ25_STRAF|nr:mitochondrial import inner membrane translocase [Striga asiatica]
MTWDQSSSKCFCLRMRDLRADSLFEIILLCLLSFIILSCCSSASSEVELLLRLVCCGIPFTSLEPRPQVSIYKCIDDFNKDEIRKNLDGDGGGAGNVPSIWLYLELHSPTKKKEILMHHEENFLWSKCICFQNAFKTVKFKKVSLAFYRGFLTIIGVEACQLHVWLDVFR